MNTGDSGGFASAPNRADGLGISLATLFWSQRPASKAKLYACLQGLGWKGEGLGWKGGSGNEGLKNLVGKQSSPRRQADAVVLLLHQSITDQFCDRRLQVIQNRLAEGCGDVSQVHASVQAQSEKKSFLQRRRAQNRGSLRR